jgi:hypothetical protein
MRTAKVLVCCIAWALASPSETYASSQPVPAEYLQAGCGFNLSEPANKDKWTMFPPELGHCQHYGQMKHKWFVYRRGSDVKRCDMSKPSCPKALPQGVDAAAIIEESFVCREYSISDYKVSIKPLTRKPHADVERHRITTIGSMRDGKMTGTLVTMNAAGKVCRTVDFQHGGPIRQTLRTYHSGGKYTDKNYVLGKLQRTYEGDEQRDAAQAKAIMEQSVRDAEAYRRSRYKFYLIGTIKGGVSSAILPEDKEAFRSGFQLHATYAPCSDGICVGGLLTLGADAPTSASETRFAELGGAIYSWYLLLYAGAGPRFQSIGDERQNGAQLTAALGFLFSSLYLRVFDMRDEPAGLEFGAQIHVPIIF